MQAVASRESIFMKGTLDPATPLAVEIPDY